MFVRQQPPKKPIASETDARKMKSFARLGGLKEAPASIGGEYFTAHTICFGSMCVSKNLRKKVFFDAQKEKNRRSCTDSCRSKRC